MKGNFLIIILGIACVALGIGLYVTNEIAKRDSKIKELEGQNDEMTKKLTELNGSIGSLEKQIADTEKRLAASEGDRAFLLKELKRLQIEKAELERQFNDLVVLRDQVR